ncbi:unnamed protein product [Ixodes persulcatus]
MGCTGNGIQRSHDGTANTTAGFALTRVLLHKQSPLTKGRTRERSLSAVLFVGKHLRTGLTCELTKRPTLVRGPSRARFASRNLQSGTTWLPTRRLTRGKDRSSAGHVGPTLRRVTP